MSLNVECCKCSTYHPALETLMPRRCIVEHGFKAHRICTDCWFGEKGFARENENHDCPGCIAKIPLTVIPGSSDVVEIE